VIRANKSTVSVHERFLEWLADTQFDFWARNQW